MSFEDGYGIMPNTLLFDTSVSSTAKLCYCFIGANVALHGYCTTTNEAIADAFGVSVRQIERWLSQLKAYLKIDILEGVRTITIRYEKATDEATLDVGETTLDVARTTKMSETIIGVKKVSRDTPYPKINRSLNYDAAEIAALAQEFPSLDVPGQLELARLYLDSIATAYVNYRSFFKGWLKRSNMRKPTATLGVRGPTAPPKLKEEYHVTRL